MPTYENVYRICEVAPSKLYTLDGVGRIDLLKSLAESVARDEISKLIKWGFFAETAEPFIPVP
jgi:hypothetical protein